MKRNEHPEEDSHSSKRAKTETKKIEVANDAFDCIVCYEFMGGEIQSCKNGHLWCGTCDKKLKAEQGCPTCRDKTKCRSLVSERMASQMVPKCPNECGFAGSDLKAHESKCPKYPFICLSCKAKYTQDDVKSYVEHQKMKHGAAVLAGWKDTSNGYSFSCDLECGNLDSKFPLKGVVRRITTNGELLFRVMIKRPSFESPFTIRVFVCTLQSMTLNRRFTARLTGANGKKWQIDSNLLLLPPTRNWTYGEFLVASVSPALLLCTYSGALNVHLDLSVPPVPGKLSMFKSSPAPSSSDYEDDWPELSSGEDSEAE